jgi:hypothetical protein
MNAFSPGVLETIRNGKYLWIRAGGDHRFIAIWVVVVGKRVFIRSWNVKPDGWHQVFLDEKQGAIRVAKDGPETRVRAIRTRSKRVKDAVDRAFAKKYTSPSSLKYVRGFRLARRRDTTTELVPR